MKLFFLCLLALVPAASAAKNACAPEGFHWRGVFEGFYGAPWSWAQRREMVRWMGARHLNLLIIAPKDDDILRRFWRAPLSREYLEGLRSVVKSGRESGVETAWELSPGLDFKGTDGDIGVAVAKFESVISLGIHNLALAFDDTPALPGHIDFANAVLIRLTERHPELVMTFVPADYYGGAAPSAYLKEVGSRLDPRFLVGWTGGGILSRTITGDETRRWRDLVVHPLVLGDNYPVQDRLLDAGRLFLGPIRGRDAGLAGANQAYIANASPLPEISKIALQSSAEYACHPQSYRPPANPALGGFAGQNSCSWLWDDFDGECSSLESAVDRYWLEGGADAPLRRSLLDAAALPERLDIGPGLRRELAPWMRKTAALSRAGLAALEIDQALRRKKRPSAAQLQELNRRLVESDLSAAIVGNLSLERFVGRALNALEGGPSSAPISLGKAARLFIQGTPGSREDLKGILDRMIAGPARLADIAQYHENQARELAPWVLVLADAAGRARAAMEPRPGFPPPWRWARKWLARARVIREALPLYATREILERFFDKTEASIILGTPQSSRPLPWAMRVWLKIQAKDSIPARLSRALAQSDEKSLRETFQAMIDVSLKLRRAGLLEEIGPWFYAGESYGRMGLKALDLRSSSAEELARWRLDRQRLLSANGLEMCVEIKLLLDGLTDWLETPADARRPLDLKIPADLSDIF